MLHENWETQLVTVQKKYTPPKVIPHPLVHNNEFQCLGEILNLAKLQIPERKNLKKIFHHFSHKNSHKKVEALTDDSYSWRSHCHSRGQHIISLEEWNMFFVTVLVFVCMSLWLCLCLCVCFGVHALLCLCQRWPVSTCTTLPDWAWREASFAPKFYRWNPHVVIGNSACFQWKHLAVLTSYALSARAKKRRLSSKGRTFVNGCAFSQDCLRKLIVDEIVRNGGISTLATFQANFHMWQTLSV